MASVSATAELARTGGKKPLYTVLYVQVLFAIVLGGIIGWLFPDIATNDWIKALGDGFIKLIKMVIAPIIFVTVVSGIAISRTPRRSAASALRRWSISRSSRPLRW
jgi:aerobic C4-dicarboxylate transport protein